MKVLVVRGKRYADAPFEYRYCDAGNPERVVTGERIDVRLVDQIPAGSTAGADRFAALLNRSSEDLSPIRSGTVDLILKIGRAHV